MAGSRSLSPCSIRMKAEHLLGCHGWLCRTGQSEAFISSGRDCIAFLPIGADAADVGHEHARLAGDVGTHVPGCREWVQRRVSDLIDVLDPVLLCSARRLDAIELAVGEVAEAIGDPVDVLL